MHPSTGNHRQPDYSSHSPQHNNRKAEISNESENSNSIVLNSMLHTGDQTSYVGSSLNKNYLDSYRVSPVHTTMTTPMTPVINSNSTPAAGLLTTNNTTLTKSNQQAHLQKLLTGSVKNSPQLQINDVVLTKNMEKLSQLQESNNSSSSTNQAQLILSDQRGQQSVASPAMPMSSVLSSQLNELKNLTQPLGTNLLSNNEQQLCKVFNLPPTTYLSLKTLLLSGTPVTINNLSPVESSLRKYFIKVGWLSH